LRPAAQTIRVVVILAAALLISHAYFYNGAQWNHNARLDMIFATVEGGAPLFSIDSFISDHRAGKNTGDWSFFQGHFYSNKAPGSSLLGIPAYFCFYHAERLVGVDPAAPGPALWNAYLVHVLVTVVPLVLSLPFALFLFLRLSGGRLRWAVFCTVSLYWGTFLFPYATQLWGHCTAAAFVIVALSLFQRCGVRTPLAVGACSGAAVLCEYSCAIAVCAIGVGYLVRRDLRSFGTFCLGGLPALGLFAWYHTVCFGAPWRIANFYINPIFQDDAGLFSEFYAEAIYGLSFSGFHGAFRFMPVLLLGLLLLPLTGRNRDRVFCVVCVLMAGGFLAMNLTFNGWHGGYCIGPRYQIPVLIAYVVPLCWLPGYRWARAGAVLLSAAGIVCMSLIAMISASYPENARLSPLRAYTGWFWDMVTGRGSRLHPFPGQIRDQASSEVYQLQHFNWGELVGLQGAASALPWVVAMGAAALLVYRLTAAVPPTNDDGGSEPEPTA
jgi:hypothetical protein